MAGGRPRRREGSGESHEDLRYEWHRILRIEERIYLASGVLRSDWKGKRVGLRIALDRWIG